MFTPSPGRWGGTASESDAIAMVTQRCVEERVLDVAPHTETSGSSSPLVIGPSHSIIFVCTRRAFSRLQASRMLVWALSASVSCSSCLFRAPELAVANIDSRCVASSNNYFYMVCPKNLLIGRRSVWRWVGVLSKTLPRAELESILRGKKDPVWHFIWRKSKSTVPT